MRLVVLILSILLAVLSFLGFFWADGPWEVEYLGA